MANESKSRLIGIDLLADTVKICDADFLERWLEIITVR